jgi:hypothetical protein
MTDIIQDLFLLAEKKGIEIHKNVLFPGWTLISKAGVRMVLPDILKLKSVVENYNAPRA